MCRYCPRTAITCLEPADEPVPLCAFCTVAPAGEQLATAAMAEHAAVAEHAPLCDGCHADITEDLTRAPCGLCGRAETPDHLDHVDVLAGLGSITVCHVCILGHREAMESICDAATAAAIDAMEASFDLAGPLSTDADWSPANDAYDAGDAA